MFGDCYQKNTEQETKILPERTLHANLICENNQNFQDCCKRKQSLLTRLLS